MEENVQVIAKRLWHVVRVAFFMLRKNICKKKLLLDLKYFTMKRPKLASKSHKLAIHHQDDGSGGAYEFGRDTSPRNRVRHHGAPIRKEEERDHQMQSVERVLESMMAGQNGDSESSPYPYFYSPVLPGFGFGRSPVVRVTDSPYPVLTEDQERETGRVDEAAEEFIQRFYTQLRQQHIN